LVAEEAEVLEVLEAVVLAVEAQVEVGNHKRILFKILQIESALLLKLISSYRKNFKIKKNLFLLFFMIKSKAKIATFALNLYCSRKNADNISNIFF